MDAIEDDFVAVRRDVEIANHKAGWQFGQLVFGRDCGLNCQRSLRSIPPRRNTNAPGIAGERDSASADCEDQARQVVGSTVSGGGTQRKYGSDLRTGIDKVFTVRGPHGIYRIVRHDRLRWGGIEKDPCETRFAIIRDRPQE